jgi:hypothetical protein
MKRRFLLATALIASAIPTASAYEQQYFGKWASFKGRTADRREMCGIRTEWKSKSLLVKLFNGNGYLTVQIFKDTWSFPDTMPVPVTISFDRDPWTIKGKGIGTYSKPDNLPMVEFIIEGSQQSAEFLGRLGLSNEMWVRFDEGNEQPWIADLVGSRPAVDSFMACVRALPEVTQPYATKPTQPFRTEKPVRPTRKKQDDNGI